mmetsp:Transcript_9046/g.23674  ORF Transcript_9046/g.23674 Transcript_9046/m.23674 type:complete len:278 (-) Transcript_9046:253-1086(-)
MLLRHNGFDGGPRNRQRDDVQADRFTLVVTVVIGTHASRAYKRRRDTKLGRRCGRRGRLCVASVAKDHAAGDRAAGKRAAVDNAARDHSAGDRVAGDHFAGDHAAGDHAPGDRAAGEAGALLFDCGFRGLEPLQCPAHERWRCLRRGTPRRRRGALCRRRLGASGRRRTKSGGVERSFCSTGRLANLRRQAEYAAKNNLCAERERHVVAVHDQRAHSGTSSNRAGLQVCGTCHHVLQCDCERLGSLRARRCHRHRRLSAQVDRGTFFQKGVDSSERA